LSTSSALADVSKLSLLLLAAGSFAAAGLYRTAFWHLLVRNNAVIATAFVPDIIRAVSSKFQHQIITM